MKTDSPVPRTSTNPSIQSSASPSPCSSIPDLILASESPRRKAILAAMGLKFTVVPPDAEEAHDPVYYKRTPFVNAVSKAESVASKYPGSLVIGADTVIEFEDKTIGKPADIEDAARILEMLSGKSHLVVTAICLIRKSDSLKCIFGDTTEVWFKELDRKTISEYLSKVNTLDKAGAYAIQEHGEMLIEKISGSSDNVTGLPSEKLAAALKSIARIPNH